MIPEEQSSQWMLHTTTHLHQISQDILPAVLIGLDVDCAHCYQEIQPGDNVASILHQLVQSRYLQQKMQIKRIFYKLKL